MLEHLSENLIELIIMTAIAGALTSILYGRISVRRVAKKRKQWEAEEQQRIDAINQTLNGGRDA